MLMPLTAEHSQLMLQNLENGWGRWGQRILIASVIDGVTMQQAPKHAGNMSPKELGSFGLLPQLIVFVPLSLVSLPQ